MHKLYPFKFKPQFFQKVWGGKNLTKLYHLENDDTLGEAWLLSSIEGKESEIINGEWAGNNIVEMIEVFMDVILGEHIFYTYGDTFPLLIKLIDTSEWLSIQVHPDDNWAKKLEKQQTCGKNELWYFIKTANNAQILHGLSRLADQDIIMKYLNEKNIEGIFRNINVSPHSYIYTPAGTVHALGPGLFLAEIQQTSDITYRIYDWDRPQDPKNPRPLHLDKAFKVINYDAIPEDLQYQPIIADRTVNLFNGENFVINRIVLSSGKQIEKDIEPFDSFFVYLILNGNGKIICDTYVVEIMAGDCCLIPACFSNVIIQSDKDILALEVYIQ